jgi:sec-independent protein translocase protein TatA
MRVEFDIRPQRSEVEMFGIGMPELIVILVIIMIIFGAGKLPEIGAGIGKGIRNFKRATMAPEKIASPKKKNKDTEDEDTEDEDED